MHRGTLSLFAFILIPAGPDVNRRCGKWRKLRIEQRRKLCYNTDKDQI